MSENPKKRLSDHNFGRVKPTRRHKLFEIIHAEMFNTGSKAPKQEKRLKNGHYKRRFINKLSKLGS